MKINYLRYFTVAALLLSGLMIVCFDSLTNGFISTSLYEVDEYLYLKDIHGSTNDDRVIFPAFGYITIIISMIMLFIKKLNYFVGIGFLVFISLFLFSSMIEGDPINQLIMNTIKFDRNIYLILWLLFFLIYTVLLLILNFKKKDTVPS